MDEHLVRGVRVYGSSESYVGPTSHLCFFFVRETKCYTCVITGGREHTVSAEPNGHTSYVITSDKGAGICFCPCSFVCLFVSNLAGLLKTRAWIWMKCCVSTDVGTWTNWLTFEPDPDYSPDTGTGLLAPISYKRWNAEFYYVGKIPRIHIGRPSLV